MPHFFMRWVWKDESLKAMTDTPQDREPPAAEIIGSFGGKMTAYYFTFGEYDGLLIAEFPSNEAAAACSMKISSAGVFQKLETQVLLTPKEAQQAMQIVKDSSSIYRHPGSSS